MRDGGLTDQARAIIDGARGLDNPSGAARERARKAVLARIAAGGTVAAIPAGVAAASAPVLKLVVPALLVVAVGGAGGGLWWRAARRAEATHAALLAPRPAAGPVAPAPPPPPPPSVERTVMAPAATVAAPVPRPQRPRNGKAQQSGAASAIPAAAPPAGDLREETVLLARVNDALRAGAAARGLALLDEYDRRFPDGVLREETTATRIIARCQAGQADAAGMARTFVQAHPRSPLGSRVRSSCLIEPRR